MSALSKLLSSINVTSRRATHKSHAQDRMNSVNLSSLYNNNLRHSSKLFNSKMLN